VPLPTFTASVLIFIAVVMPPQGTKDHENGRRLPPSGGIFNVATMRIRCGRSV
jgi:hypothetical protein